MTDANENGFSVMVDYGDKVMEYWFPTEEMAESAFECVAKFTCSFRHMELWDFRRFTIMQRADGSLKDKK